jgi:hypothetical protein
MAPAMRFPQGLKRRAVNPAGGKSAWTDGDEMPAGEPAKARGRSDFEHRPRAVVFRTAMVFLMRRGMMRILRRAGIRQRRGYGGNSDASILAIEIGWVAARVSGFGPVRL